MNENPDDGVGVQLAGPNPVDNLICPMMAAGQGQAILALGCAHRVFDPEANKLLIAQLRDTLSLFRKDAMFAAHNRRGQVASPNFRNSRIELGKRWRPLIPWRAKCPPFGIPTDDPVQHVSRQLLGCCCVHRLHEKVRPVVDQLGVVAGADEAVVEGLHFDAEHLNPIRPATTDPFYRRDDVGGNSEAASAERTS